MAVSSPVDVLRVMAQGASNRAVAETWMNERSSRSHSVLSVVVDGHICASGAASHGCLHLVDLAGTHVVPPDFIKHCCIKDTFVCLEYG